MLEILFNLVWCKMFVSLQNLHDEIQPPNVMVFSSEIFGRKSGHKNSDLKNEISLNLRRFHHIHKKICNYMVINVN